MSILAANGFKTEYLDLSQIDQLSLLEPEVVIVGSEGGPETEPGEVRLRAVELSQALKEKLSDDVKVLAIGTLGTDVLSLLRTSLALGLTSVARSRALYRSDYLIPEAPSDIISGLPMGGPISVYDDRDKHQSDLTTIYDGGSRFFQGWQGIVRNGVEGGCVSQYWLVAKQANNAVWGYGLDPQLLTDDGRALFINLVKHMRSIPASRSESERRFFDPGRYSGTFGCNFWYRTYAFKVFQTGVITLSVTSNTELALILNGPGLLAGTGGAFDRVDRVSPSLFFCVTEEELSRGDTWLVHVAYGGFSTVRGISGAPPDTLIEYTIEIGYPPKATPTPTTERQIVDSVIARVKAGQITSQQQALTELTSALTAAFPKITRQTIATLQGQFISRMQAQGVKYQVPRCRP